MKNFELLLSQNPNLGLILTVAGLLLILLGLINYAFKSKPNVTEEVPVVPPPKAEEPEVIVEPTEEIPVETKPKRKYTKRNTTTKAKKTK